MSANSQRTEAMQEALLTLTIIKAGGVANPEPAIRLLQAALEAGSAGPALPEERATRRLYHKDASYQEYLRYRFGDRSSTSTSFYWDGHRWKYLYTDFDDSGDFDVLLAAAPSATAEPEK